MLATSSQNEICIWDLASQKELCRLANEGTVALELGPNARHLVSCSAESISMWQIEPPVLLKRLHQRGSHLSGSIAWSHDGGLAAVALYNRVAVIDTNKL